MLYSLGLFALQASLAYATILNQFARNGRISGSAFGIPGINATYDYVIVGGGTAGSVVAARLTEHSNATVALIEAGSFYEIQNGNWSQIPAYNSFWVRGTPDAPQPLIDWGLYTEPQVNGKVLRYTQGKNLGGGSGRNQMIYHNGPIGAYQEWATRVGDDTYTWDNFRQFIQRSVRFSPNAERRPPGSTPPEAYDASAYSPEGGPLRVSLAAFPNPYSSYAIPAFEAMGLKRLPGLSSGKLSGYANIQATIDPSTGLRSSAENTFLNEAFGRTTLTTYINAHARNIVFGEKKAIGVNVTIDGRYPFVLSARKEVIVSAGVWHSPQLLMVSGIGPRATLDKFGVPVLSDLPGVGQNIWDSCPVSGPAYIVEDKKYDEWSSIPPGERAVLADSLLLQNASGPLTAQGSEYMGWDTLPLSYRSKLSNATQAGLAQIPPDWPLFEYLANSNTTALTAAPNAPVLARIVAILVAPFSRGNMTISSASNLDPPVINPNWLRDPRDQEIAVQGYKRLREAWKNVPHIGEEVFPGANVTTDAQVLRAIMSGSNIGPVHHGAASCAMGKSSDPMAVVDAWGRVYGVQGLRVVDASSLPFTPPGHTQGYVYSHAEKLVQDILDDM